MMEVFLEKLARNEPINLNEVKKIALERNREATEILLKIKDLVEGKFKKESILNSVVMGINIATINYEFFDEFFEELKGKYRLQ